jgi:hypothetical protein
LSTAHTSKSTSKGSKQVISLPIFGDITVEMKVRGYKSSEGDSVFPDPHDLEAPQNVEDVVTLYDPEEVWEDEGGSS